MRPIAGTNGSDDNRGEGHNESRAPLRPCTGVFQGRLPAARRRATRNTPVHGRRGPGSIAAGSTGECSFLNLREKDARCKRAAQQRSRKAEKKNARNTGKTHGPKQKTRKTEKTATRPRKKQKTPQPLGRKKNQPQKTKENLGVDVQADVRIEGRGCLHETQGATKTPGPPGTAGVFVAPAPETKNVDKEKEHDQQTHILHSFQKKKKQVVGTMPPTPKGGRGRTRDQRPIAQKGAKA